MDKLTDLYNKWVSGGKAEANVDMQKYKQLQKTGGCFPIDIETIVTHGIPMNVFENLILPTIQDVYLSKPDYWNKKMQKAQSLVRNVVWHYSPATNVIQYATLLGGKNPFGVGGSYDEYLKFARDITKEVIANNLLDILPAHNNFKHLYVCNMMLFHTMDWDDFFMLWGYKL